MLDTNQSEELLSFFKALADANRLKIVGHLAKQPCSVQKLAELLEVSESTTSHHLARLSEVGLVSARADGHYYIYSLQTEALNDMAQRLLKTETLPRLSEESQQPAFEKKVMTAFVDKEGKIKAFPAQEKKYQVLLRYVLQAFEPGVHYPEKQVNEILQRFNEDTASLRRGMIEYHYMEREGGGGAYWRTA